MRPVTVVIVDDDPDILTILAAWCAHPEREVHVCQRGADAMRQIEELPVDLLVVDMVLPDTDGVTLIERLKARDPDAAALLITGNPDAKSARDAFRAGAMDYLFKPLEPEPVRASVQEALVSVREARGRRDQLVQLEQVVSELVSPASPKGPEADPEPPLVIDEARGEARLRGRVLELTPIELRVLSHLQRHRGRVVGHLELARAAKHEVMELWEAREFCKAHVRNLRRKIESDPAHPTLLVTAYGRGYRLG